MREFNITIEYGTIEFEVGGVIKKGSPRTYDYPGDPDEVVINSVIFEGHESIRTLKHESLEGIREKCEERLL